MIDRETYCFRSSRGWDGCRGCDWCRRNGWFGSAVAGGQDCQGGGLLDVRRRRRRRRRRRVSVDKGEGILK